MDKGEIRSLIDTLEKSQTIVGQYRAADAVIPDYDMQILGKAYATYVGSYESWTKGTKDPRILDVRTFHRFVNESEIGALIDYLYHELAKQEKPQPEVKKEETSVPPELESLVAEYEKFKAEQKENDGSAHSVADAVKRAREAMILRERLATIRKNRAAMSDHPDQFNASEDKRYEDLIVKLCNPKAKDQEALLEPVETTLVEAVHSYIDQRTDISPTQREQLSQLTPEIVKNAQYLYLTGSLDVANHNDLVVGVEVAIHLTSPQTNTPITLIYDELVKQEQEISSIRRNINNEQVHISSLQSQLQQAKSKDEQQRILSEITSIQQNIDSLSTQIDSIPTRLDRSITDRSNQIESHLQSQVEGTVNNNNVIRYVKDSSGKYVPDKNPDGSLVIDRDFTDGLSDKAGKTISGIHEKLTGGGIVGKFPPQSDQLANASAIETAIRKQLPGIGLSVNATYEASSAGVILNDPRAHNPDVSSQAVLLFGKGLTTQKLDEAIAEANRHPDSDLGRLLKANPDLFGNLRQQLANIEKTQNPEYIAQNNPHSEMGQLYSQNKAAFDAYFKLAKKLSPQELADFAKQHNVDPKIFTKISQEFNVFKKNALATEIGKPIGQLGKVVTGIQNRVVTVLGKITPYANFIVDPIGSIRSYVGRKAGEYILKKVASVLSEEAGKMLLKNGFKGAIKELSKEAAKRLAAEATKMAVRAGLLATDAALSSTGVGIIVAIALEVAFAIASWTVGAIKKGLDQISQALYGEEFDIKTAARDAATAVGAGAIAGTTAVVGFTAALIAAAAAAAYSAMGIIAVSTFIGYFLYVSALVVGPLISTLAQLESQPASASKTCNGASMKNDKATCNGGYCFPVNDTSTVSYVTAHHDYPANDIMRIGDKPGPDDDIPLPLLAYTSGTIIWTSENNSLGGFAFILAGNDGMFYYYAHNMCNLVSVGDSVSAGDVVAGMDSTGNAKSTYEHVHFQISDQADCTTTPENYPHFKPPWIDFCDKLGMCGPLNVGQYPEFTH